MTPYQFEPYLLDFTESDSDHHSTPNDEENPDENRLNNTLVQLNNSQLFS